MAGNKEKLLIVGAGETAELAYDYFTNDSSFEVVGFSVEREFIKKKTLLDLPVVPFEEVERFFTPKTHRAFVAISYTMLNTVRERLFNLVKVKGYALCTYISPKAYIGKNVKIGENCFILENVTIQRGAEIGDNITIWSGSSVGHRSTVCDNCFLASHVAISGFCNVLENCFFGVNSCTADGLKIAKNSVIGAGAVLLHDTSEGRVYVGNPAKPLQNKTAKTFIEGEEKI